MRKYIENLILITLILVSIPEIGLTTYASKTLSLPTPKQAKAIITIDGTEVKFNNNMGHPLITRT